MNVPSGPRRLLQTGVVVVGFTVQTTSANAAVVLASVTNLTSTAGSAAFLAALQVACAAANETAPTGVGVTAPSDVATPCAMRGLAENNVTGVGAVVVSGCGNTVAGAGSIVTGGAFI